MNQITVQKQNSDFIDNLKSAVLKKFEVGNIWFQLWQERGNLGNHDTVWYSEVLNKQAGRITTKNYS